MNQEQHQLFVPGISCNHCKQSIETALREAGAQAQVDVATKKVAVTFSAPLTLPQVIATIEAQGYDVSP